ncbi:hypothetical protein JOF29_008633 [Kribbella aluminosa]|uniref:Uncharacterized protein n=1 Tax=Kribbella aluminosa TaxID=416017 RepID=A0ABS4V0T6_9ACTN|nr:hypothetical protein [Kribbella aluminosa]MBP2357523.1 hypothetical protein [Kribbella aluminosa]
MNGYDPRYAIARTATEVLLYLELNACPDCGSDQADWQDRLSEAELEPVLGYAGVCLGCGTHREYLFSLPQEPRDDGLYSFGGPEPSELIDAGQWLAVADRIAGQVPVGDRSETARAAMVVARQAVEEVVKFIPPTADVVPDEAFWTEPGQGVRALDPGRFRLERLLLIRDSYSDPA